MPYKMTFRCPDCRHLFQCVLAGSDEPPDHCPSCKSFVGIDPATYVPAAPAIGGSLAAKSADQVYRQLEDSSAVRAEAAGDPSLKVTNMRDNVKIGEVHAMPVNNEVSRTAEALREANGEKNAYYSETMAATLQLANTGPGITKGSNVGLKAIQGGRAPSVPVKPTVAGMRGGFGGGVR